MVRGPNGQLWPAWVFCTRYSDRPSSGPRMRKPRKPKSEQAAGSSQAAASCKGLPRGQEAEDGILTGAAEEAASRVHRQPISHRREAKTPLLRTWTFREPAQDLVPEQASEAEEVDGGQGGPGQDAGVAGAVQPPDRCHGRGRDASLAVSGNHTLAVIQIFIVLYVKTRK